MKKRLLIVGGHGSGEIAMSIFEDMNVVTNEWDIIGYLTDIRKPGHKLGKHTVIGSTAEIMDYVTKGYYIHNALYFNAKDKKNRVIRFKELDIPLEVNVTGVHPTAMVTPGVEMGYGVLVNQFALLQVNCQIENFVHVYSGSLVGHDSHTQDYCTIGAHSIVGGRVNLKEGVHVGLNSTIREDITVGEYAVIGMSGVVVKNVSDFDIVVGNPAKSIKKL